jgi:hypothetical protein
MAKKSNNSLADFDFLDDIAKEFPETPKEDKKEKGRVEQKSENTKKDRKPTTSKKPEKLIEPIVKQGRPSGYFVQQFHEELKVGSKNIAIYEPIHEELKDLVYFIDKIHLKEGKDRVSLLGVTVKALMIGIEEMRKEYGIS